MKTLILFSGGIDSTVALAMSMQKGSTCICISFDYGQRHHMELKSAATIARHYKVPHKVIKMDSHLFDSTLDSTLVNQASKDLMPKATSQSGMPHTYLPARNTLFLAHACSQAEMLEADEIIIGTSQLDHSSYPDCQPEYFSTFQALLNMAPKKAIGQKTPQLMTPLIHMKKTEIICLGLKLKAPLHLTFTCCDPIRETLPCQRCEACVLRNKAYHSILYQGHKEQLRRCKPAERKDTTNTTVNV